MLDLSLSLHVSKLEAGGYAHSHVSNQIEIIHAACHWFPRVNGFASANPNNLLVHLHGPLSFPVVEGVGKEIIRGM